MWLTCWIGSAFGHRRNAHMIQSNAAPAMGVFVGQIGSHRGEVTAEFWGDGRFRLVDSRGDTILAGSIEDGSLPGGSKFTPGDASAMFADVIRGTPDDPAIRREREDY